MSLFSRWLEKANNYFDVRLRLFQLGLIERTSKVVGRLLFSFICICLLLATLLFVGFGLMEVFANWLGSRAAGAFLVAGLFVVGLLVMFLMQKFLLRAFADIFVRTLTGGDDDSDEVGNAAEGNEGHSTY